MPISDLQHLCETGQDLLQRMQYLEAEQTLAQAEQLAWVSRDWDSLSRLYMPLQESRRQRRQRCGEGTIRLDFFTDNPLDAAKTVQQIHQGEILIAGAASIQPALAARLEQSKSNVYVDVFLAAVYAIGAGRIIAIIPDADIALPPNEPMSPDALIRRLPPHSLTLTDSQLQSSRTYADTMALWEQLHAPFLAAADAVPDPIRRIDAYRKTISVDYACELAHQRISDTARKLRAGAKS